MARGGVVIHHWMNFGLATKPGWQYNTKIKKKIDGKIQKVLDEIKLKERKKITRAQYT